MREHTKIKQAEIMREHENIIKTRHDLKIRITQIYQALKDYTKSYEVSIMNIKTISPTKNH